MLKKRVIKIFLILLIFLLSYSVNSIEIVTEPCDGFSWGSLKNRNDDYPSKLSDCKCKDGYSRYEDTTGVTKYTWNLNRCCRNDRFIQKSNSITEYGGTCCSFRRELINLDNGQLCCAKALPTEDFTKILQAFADAQGVTSPELIELCKVPGDITPPTCSCKYAGDNFGICEMKDRTSIIKNVKVTSSNPDDQLITDISGYSVRITTPEQPYLGLEETLYDQDYVDAANEMVSSKINVKITADVKINGIMIPFEDIPCNYDVPPNVGFCNPDGANGNCPNLCNRDQDPDCAFYVADMAEFWKDVVLGTVALFHPTKNLNQIKAGYEENFAEPLQTRISAWNTLIKDLASYADAQQILTDVTCDYGTGEFKEKYGVNPFKTFSDNYPYQEWADVEPFEFTLSYWARWESSWYLLTVGWVVGNLELSEFVEEGESISFDVELNGIFVETETVPPGQTIRNQKDIRSDDLDSYAIYVPGTSGTYTGDISVGETAELCLIFDRELVPGQKKFCTQATYAG